MRWNKRCLQPVRLPYFARRKVNAELKALFDSRVLGQRREDGVIIDLISEDRNQAIKTRHDSVTEFRGKKYCHEPVSILDVYRNAMASNESVSLFNLWGLAFQTVVWHSRG